MNKIKNEGNGWHQHDTLNGKPLENGEMLTVQWNDGICMPIQVVLQTQKETVNDMGSPYVCTNSVAFAPIYYHGHWFNVPLCGIKAKRGLK